MLGILTLVQRFIKVRVDPESSTTREVFGCNDRKELMAAYIKNLFRTEGL
jgi:hypothetical protein